MGPYGLQKSLPHLKSSTINFFLCSIKKFHIHGQMILNNMKLDAFYELFNYVSGEPNFFAILTSTDKVKGIIGLFKSSFHMNG